MHSTHRLDIGKADAPVGFVDMFGKLQGLLSGPQVPEASRSTIAAPNPAPAPAPAKVRYVRYCYPFPVPQRFLDSSWLSVAFILYYYICQ